MSDDFKEEFINTTSQSKEEFGWSLIEGILELYLFRVYDFSKTHKRWVHFFLLSLVLKLPVSACNNTRRPLNNNNDGRLLKSAFVSFQQKRLVVIL